MVGVSIPGFRARREAREDALALLYEVEIVGYTASEALARRPVALSDYAVELALGVEKNLSRIDDAVRRHLVDWRLERLAVVDRTLARMAACELIHRPDVPTGVVLSEAVALATQYCGAESPRFLNGLLRAVANDVRASALPVPELAGKLTRMRMWRPEDAAVLVKAWQDPLIQQRMPVPQTADVATASRWIEQRGRAWTEGSSVDLAVSDPASGDVIGEVGLSGMSSSERSSHRAALAGWWIMDGWRGQGRASEAVRLVTDWALSLEQVETVMAEIHVYNVASAAVARKAGLRRVEAVHPDPAKRDIQVFARSRPSDGDSLIS